jgi:hypothetical protein
MAQQNDEASERIKVVFDKPMAANPPSAAVRADAAVNARRPFGTCPAGAKLLQFQVRGMARKT